VELSGTRAKDKKRQVILPEDIREAVSHDLELDWIGNHIPITDDQEGPITEDPEEKPEKAIISKTPSVASALEYAVRAFNLEWLESLAKAGADLDQLGTNGESLMHVLFQSCPIQNAKPLFSFLVDR
jgi:hypothetical protein